MHPMFEYDTIRREHEELLRQAEQERMTRSATVSDWMNRGYHRRFANWLGSHIVSWGRKSKNFGKSGKLSALWPASPHH